MPLKQQLFGLVKQVYTPPKRIYQHLSFQGVFSIVPQKGHCFRMWHYGYELENDIFWAGLLDGWEKVSIGLWVKLCANPKNQVIIDVGANTGIYALVAKCLNPNATVHAFEPVKRVCEKLSANVALNGYDIGCHEVGLSNYDGEAVIYETDGEHVYSVTVNQNIHSQHTAVKETRIRVQRLDTFIEQQALPRIDLLKIDVETHEPEVLEGFGAYLEKFKPTLLIEILTAEVAEKVSAWVGHLGYCYFNIDENKGIRQVDAIAVSDYYNFLLCTEEVAKELGLMG
jgi:FkbM family methyltransferase